MCLWMVSESVTRSYKAFRKIIKSMISTYRVYSFMLGEAHRGNAIDSDSQNGNEQMDTCDPVCKKRSGEERRDYPSLIRMFSECCMSCSHPQVTYL